MVFPGSSLAMMTPATPHGSRSAGKKVPRELRAKGRGSAKQENFRKLARIDLYVLNAKSEAAQFLIGSQGRVMQVPPAY